MKFLQNKAGGVRRASGRSFITGASLAAVLVIAFSVGQMTEAKKASVACALDAPKAAAGAPGSMARNASPVTGMLTTTSGSTIARVSSASGAVLSGDQVLRNPNIASGTIVVAISGSSIVLSQVAVGSGTRASQFGIQRLNAASAVVAESVGAANVYAGSAAGGRSTWLNEIASGSDYAKAAPFVSLAPSGGVGAASWMGSRVSDAAQTPFPANNEFMWTDYNPNRWSTWVRYTESNLTSSFTVNLTTETGSRTATVPVGTPAVAGMPIRADGNLAGGTSVAAVSGPNVTLSKPAVRSGTASASFGTVGYHIGEENSLYSLWDYQSTDPFAINPLGGTRNLRIDCGKGATFEAMGAPENCSAAVEIVDNAARYGKGIMLSQHALIPDEHGLGQAFVMAPMQALVWYKAEHTPGWSIYQDAMPGAAGGRYELQLGNGFARVNSRFVASGFSETLSTPPSSSAKCSAGQFTDDSAFHYVCTADNTWKRTALNPFTPVAVAGLPACNLESEGVTYPVRDALSPAYGRALVGGGTVHTPAYCNGHDWTAH